MKKEQVKVYKYGTIEAQKDIIKHSNAFILPSGDYILAKGYTGCNPSHQLESSALKISRGIINKDIRAEYNMYVDKLQEEADKMPINDEPVTKELFHQITFQELYKELFEFDSSMMKEVKRKKVMRLYYLRSILVHYYGYALFARVEQIESYNKRGNFIDYSVIPNPDYYGKVVTSEQEQTLKKFFEINNDGTLLPSENNSEIIYQKVLNHTRLNSNWHY